MNTLRMTASVLMAGGIAVSAAISGQSANDARVDEIFKEFTAAGSPGCAAGVYEGGKVVHRGAYGMANLDHDVKLTPDSVFHVGGRITGFILDGGRIRRMKFSKITNNQ